MRLPGFREVPLSCSLCASLNEPARHSQTGAPPIPLGSTAQLQQDGAHLELERYRIAAHEHSCDLYHDDPRPRLQNARVPRILDGLVTLGQRSTLQIGGALLVRAETNVCSGLRVAIRGNGTSRAPRCTKGRCW